MPTGAYFVVGKYPRARHLAASHTHGLVAEAGSGRNLDTGVTVVGREAEDAPHSIQRVAGSIRTSGTADRVQTSQDVLARDEGGGPVAEDAILAVLPLRLPDRARSLPGLRLMRNLA